MADTAAIYGLVGAIGGALLGAGAAVAVPVLQNRSAARARRWTLAEAEITRLVKIRSGVRAVLQLQAEAVDALAAGREVAADGFAAAMSTAFSDLRKAADDALIDGLVIPQSGGGDLPAYGWSPPSGGGRIGTRGRLHQETITSPIVVTMQRLNDDIRSALDSASEGVSAATVDSLRGQVEEVERLRAELISLLLDRVETARGRTGAPRDTDTA
ncbi:hypothetical protein [Streptantibioticus cattleyicolor]|uniref:hypothetical protein n=1 Tax=Streptantibioticus cattleyicolor TaxID=29303 RepID=UPI000213DDCE|nr:hypothetical protein [Streptantibioticus cattleyicolor]CCB71111.1 protein of unknown function [Streptantibioticus cattleyicolor NRRL 8057 = DSM 46488]